jgi:hypothetical protein
MASAPRKITSKLGEKVQASGGHQKESSLQQPKNTAKQYTIEALKQAGHGSWIALLEYDSVINMIEYLRHRNPDCAKTIGTYLGFLSLTLRVLGHTTPDDLVRAAKEADEDQLEALFLDLDDHWLGELNATATRLSKWAGLKTFLEANHVKKVRLIKCNIRTRKKTVDYALTREDCRRILDTAKITRDKLVIALLTESLQRIGTITLLTWGDVQAHLEKGEDVFLIWIDPQRTKRNIEHWAPIGPLSCYFMRKLLSEFKEKGIEVSDRDRLVGSLRTSSTGEQVHRIMVRAGVVGRKQANGHMTRYEKHVQSFRKFGKVEMQGHKVNEDVINYLMGHRRDTYSEWADRYDELLKIYKEARPQIDQLRPRLDQKEALDDILEYAKVRGFSLDPKDLTWIGDIETDSAAHADSSQGAEASTVFRSSQS